MSKQHNIVYWGIWAFLLVFALLFVGASVLIIRNTAEEPHFRLSREVRYSGLRSAVASYSPVGLIISRRALGETPQISRLTHTPPLCASSVSASGGVRLQWLCKGTEQGVKPQHSILDFRAFGSSAPGGLLGVTPAGVRITSAGQFPDRGNFSRAGSNPAEALSYLCGLNFHVSGKVERFSQLRNSSVERSAQRAGREPGLCLSSFLRNKWQLTVQARPAIAVSAGQTEANRA